MSIPSTVHSPDSKCSTFTVNLDNISLAIPERLKKKLTSHRSDIQSGPTLIVDTATVNLEIEVSEGPPLSIDPNLLASGGRSFTAMMTELGDTAEAEDLDDQLPTQVFPSKKIPIADLFDFQNPDWLNASKVSLMRSMSEEMEIHDLLDIDAEGEPDPLNDENDIM